MCTLTMVFNEQRIDPPLSFKQPTRIDNSTIGYTGSWESGNNPIVPNVFAPTAYTFTRRSNDYFTVNFMGSSILIYGSSNTDHESYSVVSQFLSDSNPGSEVTPTQAIDGTDSHTYNSTSSSALGNALLYYSDGLNGSQTHTLNVTNLGYPSILSMSYIEI